MPAYFAEAANRYVGPVASNIRAHSLQLCLLQLHENFLGVSSAMLGIGNVS